MKRNPIAVAVTILLCALLVSCNSYSNPNSGTGGSTTGTTTSKPSQLAIRAFVSNPLSPTGVAGLFSPVLNIVDASLDQLSFSTVDVSSAGSNPGLMALSPNKHLLLVFSNSNNTIGVVNTLSESLNSTSSGTAITFGLPGSTESMLVGTDNVSGYVAVPTAPVANSSQGAVVVLNLNTGATAATIPVPDARYLAQSNNGNRVLAFGEPSTSAPVTVIAPSLITSANDPRTTICCFDHPVWAGFSSDDSKAYVLDCGPECGGATAGISVIDMSAGTVGPIIPLPGAGATTALIVGTTLYVAGTPPGLGCGSKTAATACGTLDIVNLSTMTVTNPSPIVITDGYHRLMGMSNNGQLFIGANTCSNVNTSNEVRGCLSIYNTQSAGVVIPPDSGDVTGLQPIAHRDVVYLCEGGNFRIYSTDTDKLYVPPVGVTPVAIFGQPTDVKEVD